MPAYCVNKNTDSRGFHEVHEYGCDHLPDQKNRHYLGVHDSCHPAARQANDEGFSPADGCGHCSSGCHTG